MNTKTPKTTAPNAVAFPPSGGHVKSEELSLLVDEQAEAPPKQKKGFHHKFVTKREGQFLRDIAQFEDAPEYVLMPVAWWDGSDFVPGAPKGDEATWVRFPRLVCDDGTTPNDGFFYVESATADAHGRLRLLKDMQRCCEWMEKKGFVHRDVKLENMMWSRGRWVLIDFDSVTRLNDNEQPFGETDESFKITYEIPTKLYNTRHSMRLQVMLQMVRLCMFFHQNLQLGRERYRTEASLKDVKDQCLERRPALSTKRTMDPLATLLVLGKGIDDDLLCFARSTFEDLWPNEETWRWSTKKRKAVDFTDPYSPSRFQMISSPASSKKKFRSDKSVSPPMANITNTADRLGTVAPL